MGKKEDKKPRRGRLRVFQFDRQRRERSFGSLVVRGVDGKARKRSDFLRIPFHRRSPPLIPRENAVSSFDQRREIVN